MNNTKRVPLYQQKINELEWQNSELSSFDINIWSKRVCGLVCIQMIHSYFNNEKIALVDLIKSALDTDSFNERGLIHAKAISLAQGLGLRASLYRMDKSSDLLSEFKEVILAGGLMVISVASRFPDGPRKGGHLIVITKYTYENDQLIFHFNDPSQWGTENFSIPWSQLEKTLSLNTMKFFPREI